MSVIERIQTWCGNTSAVVLLIAATIAGVYDVFHRFGPREHVYSLASPEEVLIGLAALLCFGLGTERLLTLRKIEDIVQKASSQREILLQKIDRISKELRRLQSTVKGQFDDVERSEVDLLSAVSKINKAESLIGTQAIEEAALDIIRDCKDSDNINATSQYRKEDALSEAYEKAIADRVKKAKENQGDMEYRLLISAISDSSSELEERRRKVFGEKEIGNRLAIKHAKEPWPFEVLIVGNSMIIALRGGRQRATYEVAVRINDPKFVEKASEWYREVGWGKADSDS
ncbi:MAG TPA: hypothetical protein VK582_07200 [Pyrinomonadaceae bacterium]|nr:hypothetical protein [Pyrinomonadaceae bacterium]